MHLILSSGTVELKPYNCMINICGRMKLIKTFCSHALSYQTESVWDIVLGGYCMGHDMTFI